MKLPRIPKFPKFKMPRIRKETPQKLEARLRASNTATADNYPDEEPQTKLTSAFIVVLIMHVVLVGGIYAFNQIKASRGDGAPVPAEPAKTKTATGKPAAITPAAPPKVEKTAIAAPAAQVAPAQKSRIHNVKAGDTLISIAKSASVTVAELKAANAMSGDAIRTGQSLNLPAATAPAAEAPAVAPAKPVEPAETRPAPRSYTVKSGDRLIFIAKKFGVTPEDIVALNRLKTPDKLQIGQTLKIPTKR
ncbi:MAG: LysM peptidoglycan-binding domain-containing protein [Chthoniobacteraceae bacterium]